MKNEPHYGSLEYITKWIDNHPVRFLFYIGCLAIMWELVTKC